MVLVEEISMKYFIIKALDGGRVPKIIFGIDLVEVF